MQIAEGLRGAKQHEARFFVFGKIRIGFAVIYCAAQKPARTSETPALMANRGQQDAVSRRRIPDKLIRAAMERSFAFRRFQNNQVSSVFRRRRRVCDPFSSRYGL
jgi:hypothetical protein